MKTGQISFEILENLVKELPDPSNGTKPHLLRFVPRSDDAKPTLVRSASAAGSLSSTVDFSAYGAFVVDGDLFHQVHSCKWLRKLALTACIVALTLLGCCGVKDESQRASQSSQSSQSQDAPIPQSDAVTKVHVQRFAPHCSVGNDR